MAGQLPKFRYGNKSSHLRKKRNKFLLDSLRSFIFLWRLYHLSIRITWHPTPPFFPPFPLHLKFLFLASFFRKILFFLFFHEKVACWQKHPWVYGLMLPYHKKVHITPQTDVSVSRIVSLRRLKYMILVINSSDLIYL